MKAFITLLSTPGYLPGVLALAKSLRLAGTRHPLVVALSAGVPRVIEERLVLQGLQPLRLPARPPFPREFSQPGHHWSNTFDKLHLFGLTRFDKLVYLDSDMMVLCPLDELFERPHLSAVQAGRHLHPDWVRLNSGLMVIEPRAGLPERIGRSLDDAAEHAALGRHEALGDQDVINAHYDTWPSSGLQLPETYNLFHEYVDAYVAAGVCALPRGVPGPGLVKVIHFIGRHKPWTWRGVLRHRLRRVRGQAGPRETATFRAYRWLLQAPVRMQPTLQPLLP